MELFINYFEKKREQILNQELNQYFFAFSRENTAWISKHYAESCDEGYRNRTHSHNALPCYWKSNTKDILGERYETCRHDEPAVLNVRR